MIDWLHVGSAVLSRTFGSYAIAEKLFHNSFEIDVAALQMHAGVGNVRPS